MFFPEVEARVVRRVRQIHRAQGTPIRREEPRDEISAPHSRRLPEI